MRLIKHHINVLINLRLSCNKSNTTIRDERNLLKSLGKSEKKEFPSSFALFNRRAGAEGRGASRFQKLERRICHLLSFTSVRSIFLLLFKKIIFCMDNFKIGDYFYPFQVIERNHVHNYATLPLFTHNS